MTFRSSAPSGTPIYTPLAVTSLTTTTLPDSPHFYDNNDNNNKINNNNHVCASNQESGKDNLDVRCCLAGHGGRVVEANVASKLVAGKAASK